MAKFEGWSNWETWQMEVILDMNQDLDETIKRRIEEEDVLSADASGMITQTAELLSDYIEEQLPKIEFPWNVYFDSALREVDWEELAQNHLWEWGFLTKGGRKVRTGPKEWSP